ncbi:hypothetical protein [Actinoplanes couchii]|uniref:Uncharacterized protein n=1 Tax=Actinoplanes couchii TaxID=403638 RepID=A0ABQ3XRS0_9ACTN|nr:hypothetical protein [Actinoplanes couchii]MDR6318442.1 catechol 2,3-dioxygenase-like lactoylglutathione lyase family enzyme [Actinoplanes couchii]GID61199.1 hypothetical protein Aco03nite_096030 [Actinoplanes couchii]
MSNLRVPVTCCVCGQVRQVRPALVRGFDVLACSRHPASDVELPVPDGHHLVTAGGVAGHFTGYTVVATTPSQARAAHRAASTAAAAMGRPAPEPDFDPGDTSHIDPRLVRAFTDVLGPDGWEITDWRREGRYFEVKVYTDFGWAGFLVGRPEQIADQVARLRAEAQDVLATLRCPTCSDRPQACGCGTVVWKPASWTNEWNAITGALAYLEDAVDPEKTETLARLTAALDGGDVSEGEWIVYDSFAGVVQAFRELVPDARWTLLHDRPVAVIPVGAAFRPGPAGDLLAAAEQAGYRLAIRTEFARDERRSVFRFESADVWFACARVDGRYHLVAGQPGWQPDNDDSDEHWTALEATADWWILLPEDQRGLGAWTVNEGCSEFDMGAGTLVASSVLDCTELTPDVVRTALAQADSAIRDSRQRLDEYYTRERKILSALSGREDRR